MKNKIGFRKKVVKYPVLMVQKKLMEKHYSFLTYEIEKNVLRCTGWLQPEGCKTKYKIKIEYVSGHEPKTTILSPKIEPGQSIHMYNDHSLCLHYPPDMYWNSQIQIHAFTIPWISEWIVFYELYLVNGNIWEGRESPTHICESDKNINKNIE